MIMLLVISVHKISEFFYVCYGIALLSGTKLRYHKPPLESGERHSPQNITIN